MTHRLLIADHVLQNSDWERQANEVSSWLFTVTLIIWSVNSNWQMYTKHPPSTNRFPHIILLSCNFPIPHRPSARTLSEITFAAHKHRCTIPRCLFISLPWNVCNYSDDEEIFYLHGPIRFITVLKNVIPFFRTFAMNSILIEDDRLHWCCAL